MEKNASLNRPAADAAAFAAIAFKTRNPQIRLQASRLRDKALAQYIWGN